jgi:hypothetical protein
LSYTSNVDTLNRIYEESKVRSADLVQKVGQLIHEGNVRRIIVKDHSGNTYLEVPLTVAALGTIAAPVLAAMGALAGALTDCKIVVERVTPPPGSLRTAPGSNIGATEDQVDMKDTIGQRSGPRGASIEDLAGTGKIDSPGG